MTTVEYVSDANRFATEIERLLVAADEEFHPPLSAREGTTQTEGLAEAERTDDATVATAIADYRDQCLDQHFVACYEGATVRGFISFRHGYETEVVVGYQPSNYVSTVVVDPTHRRQGIARQLYETLLADLPSTLELPYVTTRTWSTNRGHLELLAELGFENVATISDDRGPGIDTVYYAFDRTDD